MSFNGPQGSLTMTILLANITLTTVTKDVYSTYSNLKRYRYVSLVYHDPALYQDVFDPSIHSEG